MEKLSLSLFLKSTFSYNLINGLHWKLKYFKKVNRFLFVFIYRSSRFDRDSFLSLHSPTMISILHNFQMLDEVLFFLLLWNEMCATAANKLRGNKEGENERKLIRKILFKSNGISLPLQLLIKHFFSIWMTKLTSEWLAYFLISLNLSYRSCVCISSFKCVHSNEFEQQTGDDFNIYVKLWK